MIIYDLACNNDHRFEGWFQSADDFVMQQDKQLISCPCCASNSVRRVPSAVAISTRRHVDCATHVSPEKSTSSVRIPDSSEVGSIYRQLVKAIHLMSEDVGDAFAEEARRIHYQDSPERPIRGNATKDECDELADEGINIVQLPIIKDEH